MRVYETEARWVRQAFTWFADHGRSIAEIARELTSLGVGKGHKSNKPGWHHAQVRRMLANEKYIGRWVWGATKTVRNSDGKVKRVPLPPEEWVVRDREELRIVDQATWEGARLRLTELDDLYGQKDGQKRRGAKPHHTEIYPKSLLGGLIYCHSCGSRLWTRGSESRSRHLGCPNHPKGLCSMAGQVSVERAERALLEFVTELLTAWPPWLESATAAMREAVAAAAGRLPQALKADEDLLADLTRKTDNLVNLLTDGNGESQALLRRLDDLEREAKIVLGRVEQGRSTLKAVVAMPQDGWIRSRLADLPTLLSDDPRRAALLLRRLLGRATAEAIVAPGKVRGYIRLHVTLDARSSLEEVLGGQLPDSVLALAAQAAGSDPKSFHLDLGGPTRSDSWAPGIATMRAEGVTWEEIGRVTGLGTGNAYNVWKRWAAAQRRDLAVRP